MSEDETTVEVLAAEDRPTLIRTVPAEVHMTGDGRTLEVLCVPYGSPATVADPPDFMAYQEEFVRGAFQAATKAPNRVLLDFEHHLDIGSVLGHGIELEERDDGLYGKFRVTDHPDGDKALRMIADGVLTGMSAMFDPIRSVRTAAGVVQRVKARLNRMSLTRGGIQAYPAAQVLAVRTAPIVSHDPLPAFDPEIAASLAKYVYVPADLQGTAS